MSNEGMTNLTPIAASVPFKAALFKFIITSDQLWRLAVSRSSFHYDICIGKGGFGKVWKVEYKKYRKIYAMKEMNKARILTKRSVKSVMNER